MASTSVGLSDIQQVRMELERIRQLEEELIHAEPRARDALMVFTRLERVALRWVSLGRQIAGSEDANKVVDVLSRVLVRMQMLYSSAGMIAGGLSTMMIPGMGWLGAIQFAGGVAGLGMAQLSIMEGY